MSYDLTDLELFVQVVDQGSITQGAERAHLSLPSASARLKAMEKALGARLLTRHRRGVVPSPAGWLLVAHARGIIGKHARMRTELARSSEPLQSPLVMLANTSATQTLAPTTIAGFLAAYPDVELDIQEHPSHEIVSAVADGRAELGIIADTVDPGQLDCVTLRPDDLVVVVPNGHPLAGREQTAFSACLDYPFVGFAQGNPLQEHLNGQTQPLGLRPRYRAHLPGPEAVCTAVAAGVGIAVVPAVTATRWAHLNVHAIALTNAWAHRNLLLCHRQQAEMSAPAAAFSTYLISPTSASRPTPRHRHQIERNNVAQSAQAASESQFRVEPNS